MNIITPEEAKRDYANRKALLIYTEMEEFARGVSLFVRSHAPDHDGCYRYRYKIREECATGLLEFADELSKKVIDCLSAAGWKNIKVELKAGAYLYAVFKA
jgi:hypothetical protein